MVTLENSEINFVCVLILVQISMSLLVLEGFDYSSLFPGWLFLRQNLSALYFIEIFDL